MAVEIGVSVPSWLSDKPLARDAADQLVANIVQENRRLIPCTMSVAEFDGLGRMTLPNQEPIVLSDTAHRQLQNRAPANTRCSSMLASWSQRSGSKCDLRVLDAPGEADPLAFAAVSDRYVPMDVHIVADIVSKAMPSDARLDVMYHGDGGRWSLYASLAGSFLVSEGEGEQRFTPQVVVRGSDDGRRALSIQFRAVRWFCTNGMWYGRASATRRVRHVGDAERVSSALAEALSGVDRDIEAFSNRWSAAYGSVWHGAMSDGKVEPIEGLEALRRLCAHGMLPTGNRRRHTVWPMYCEAFEAEPGDSVAHVVNAVTRFAHEGALASSKSWSPGIWAQEDAEMESIEIFAHVQRVLAPLDETQISRFSL